MCSFESLLKIVEERFAIVAMTARDTSAGDMIGAFNFNQLPRRPIVLAPTTAGSPFPCPLNRARHELERLSHP